MYVVHVYSTCIQYMYIVLRLVGSAMYYKVVGSTPLLVGGPPADESPAYQDLLQE